MKTTTTLRTLFVLVPLAVGALTGCIQPIDGMPMLVEESNPSTPARLTVAMTSSAAGNVTSTPAGIACPTTCSADLARGQQVTLVAQANPGWAFDHWSGDCAGAAPSATVTMDRAKVCDAIFKPVFPAPVEDGGGQTSVDPGEDTELGVGVCCAPAGSDASYTFCEEGGEKCCVPVTAVQCLGVGGKWMSVSSCEAAPPTC